MTSNECTGSGVKAQGGFAGAGAVVCSNGDEQGHCQYDDQTGWCHIEYKVSKYGSKYTEQDQYGPPQPASVLVLLVLMKAYSVSFSLVCFKFQSCSLLAKSVVRNIQLGASPFGHLGILGIDEYRRQQLSLINANTVITWLG